MVASAVAGNFFCVFDVWMMVTGCDTVGIHAIHVLQRFVGSNITQLPDCPHDEWIWQTLVLGSSTPDAGFVGPLVLV